jgi:hypothetical protein
MLALRLATVMRPAVSSAFVLNFILLLPGGFGSYTLAAGAESVPCRRKLLR